MPNADEVLVIDGDVPSYDFVEVARYNWQPLNGSEYIESISIPYSSILTVDNLRRLDTACGNLRNTVLSQRAETHTVRIDEVSDAFREAVGPELLSELRLGLEAISNPYDEQVFGMFGRNLLGAAGLALTVFATAGEDQYGSWTSWYNRVSDIDDVYSQLGRQNNGAVRRLLVCALANAAVILRSCPLVGHGTAHYLGILLARDGGAGSSITDETVRKAFSACMSAHMERADFIHLCGSDQSMGDTLWNEAYTPLGVFVHDPKRPLLSCVNRMAGLGRGGIRIDELIKIVIDDRGVEVPETEEFSMSDVFSAKLLEAGGGPAMQTKTDKLPKVCGVIPLARGMGVPYLAYKTDIGVSAILTPADMKCLKFMSKLYGVKVPTELDPLPRESDTLWKSLFDPGVFTYALQTFRKTPAAVVPSDGSGSLASSCVPYPIFVRSGDISEYIDGIEEQGMAVNEIIIPANARRNRR